MENPRVIEILEETKEVLKLNGSGICGRFSELYRHGVITAEEKEEIKDILFSHKPNDKQYQEFRNNPFWNANGIFWWTPIHRAKETYVIRVDYLDEVIKRIKSLQNG
jgi:uncharacterized protein YbcV (DUF1398 family)